MAELDALTGGSRPITEMSEEAQQMTHYPEKPNPDAAIARSIASILGSPITAMADTSARAQQSMQTWAEGGKYDPKPLGEAVTMATPARGLGRVAAPLMGLASTMAPGEASAETRKARSEREARQKREQTAAEADARLKEIAAKSAAAKGEAQEAARLAKEAEERHQQAAAEEEQHRLDMSFREKHPLLSQMFTGAGWTVSLALPYVSRVLNTKSSNAFVKEVQG